MTTPTTVITANLAVTRLGGPNFPSVVVPTVLSYDPADPFAVGARFRDATGDVEWVFSRDLLTAGMHVHIGLGDVRVWPASDPGVPVVFLTMTTLEGSVLMEFDAAELKAFLVQTHLLVPNGTEWRHIDIDGLILAIFVADAS